MLAVPATLILATAGFAQTTTTEEFGTKWPLSVGTTFLTDDTNATLRPTEELTKGWQSLSPEDQTMIRSDCDVFMAAHGDAAASGDASTTAGSTDTTGTASTDTTTGSASTDTATGTDTGTDTGTATGTDTTTGTDTAQTGTASTDTTATGTTATGDAATTAPVGYDMAEMKAICEAVGGL
jgi:hypothetical protein